MIIEARHLCMVMRGVEKQNSMATTSAMLGAFRENKQTRDEFLACLLYTSGAAAAKGDWLLFTDADTYHLHGSTRRALCDAVEHDAVLVSYSPEQEMGGFWERALIPFVYCRLANKFSFARVNDRAQPDAAANGQFLLLLRDVYEKLGGHTAIAGQILEDVALARRVKSAGYGIYFTAPIGTVRTRMYRGCLLYTSQPLWRRLISRPEWVRRSSAIRPRNFRRRG